MGKNNMFGVLFVVGVLFLAVLSGCTEKVPLTEYTTLNDTLVAEQEKNVQLSEELTTLKEVEEQTGVELESIKTELEAIKAKSAEDATKLAELEAFKAEVEAVKIEETKVAEATALAEWFVIDDLSLGIAVQATTLDNGDLSFLLDDEFEFDSDDYDFQELIILDGLQVTTSLNGDDEFGDGLALTFENEFSVVYGFVFDDAVDYALITEDEPLIIKMLGTEYIIIDASGTSFTYLQGQDFVVKEDETFSFGEHAITVGLVTDDEVAVIVDGKTKFVDEKDTEEFDDLIVRATDIYYTGKDTQKSVVILTISDKDVEVTVDNGDEFIKDDDRFEWLVDLAGTPQVIGIGLAEKADDADEEVLQPLLAGETFSFAGLFDLSFDYNDNYDYLKYTIDFKEIQVNGSDIDTVRLSGDDES